MFLKLYRRTVKVLLFIIFAETFLILLSSFDEDQRWQVCQKFQNSNLVIASRYADIYSKQGECNTMLAENENLEKNVSVLAKKIVDHKIKVNFDSTDSNISNEFKTAWNKKTDYSSKKDDSNKTIMLSSIDKVENTTQSPLSVIKIIKKKSSPKSLSSPLLSISKKKLNEGYYYSVESGDSLWLISKRHNVSMNKLMTFNNLKSLNIRIGQKLWIPGINNSSKFIWPIRGRISSGFGNRINPISKKKEFHPGIDIANKIGTPILASRSGKVSFSGWIRGYGRVVVINHSSGYSTLYAHMSKRLAKKGQHVYQGQKIGEVGTSGYSTGPHVHFEIRINGKKLNPIKYLP